MNTLRIAGFLDHSAVNGEGFRSVLFLSGCRHNCPGCHNEALQNFNYGEDIFTADLLGRILKNKPLIDGVTFSGGEPFEQSERLLPLLRELQKHKLSVWIYTGYLYETLLKDPVKSKVLPYIDVLVDGPYLKAYADQNLKYRGSSNQRFLKLTKGKLEALLAY